MKRYPINYLREVSARIFVARGAPRQDAELVATMLVQANARGLDSHGILRIPQYIKGIDEGQIRPGAQMATVVETSTTALLNVNWNFGQVGAHQAATMAMAKAREHSLGLCWAAQLSTRGMSRAVYGNDRAAKYDRPGHVCRCFGLTPISRTVLRLDPHSLIGDISRS